MSILIYVALAALVGAFLLGAGILTGAYLHYRIGRGLPPVPVVTFGRRVKIESADEPVPAKARPKVGV
jgi:hypothetical protein